MPNNSGTLSELGLKGIGEDNGFRLKRAVLILGHGLAFLHIFLRARKNKKVQFLTASFYAACFCFLLLLLSSVSARSFS